MDITCLLVHRFCSFSGLASKDATCILQAASNSQGNVPLHFVLYKIIRERDTEIFFYQFIMPLFNIPSLCRGVNQLCHTSIHPAQWVWTFKSKCSYPWQKEWYISGVLNSSIRFSTDNLYFPYHTPNWK